VKWGVGVDNVDFQACERLGIPIENTPGMFGAEVADLAICYLIGLARDAFFIDREIREGRWPKPSGISLMGRTVGVVGLGDIGGNIARRCLALGLKVIGWDPGVKSIPKQVTYQRWPEGIEDCDFIVFACALTPATEHMFNDDLLNKLKFGVRLINVSRGGLVNERVLVKALKSGLVLGAALDVFESEPLHKCHELRSFQQCVFGSHNASNTADAVERTSFLALDLMKSQLNGD
jgi:D-3-phosphoglycerate dehydrogenase